MDFCQYSRRLVYIAVIALSAATLIVYLPVRHFEFLAYDDFSYITNNPIVQSGITMEGLRWAFTRVNVSNWHPLTWLSHMLDVEIFGLNPGWHHLANAALHALNTVLLLLVFHRMTAMLWPAALVAALFAMHPLHVESVAWVAERKDMLSTFWWISAIGTYLAYLKKPNVGRYFSTLILFCLGLLSKPMVVTLPLTLLILDFWPLGRFAPPASSTAKLATRPWRGPALGLLAEKAPFISLSVVISFVAYYTQLVGGAINPLRSFSSLGARFANALVSYAAYIGKMFWPSSLAVLYPLPGNNIPWWRISAAGIVLTIITALAKLSVKRRPYLAAGWLWFLGTLLPVIGLIQVGSQAMADRYTYVPLTGLFIMAAWGIYDLAAGRPARIVAASGLAAVVVCAAIFSTRHQLGYWRNSVTLFNRTLAVTKDNWVAHVNLGWALENQGFLDAAIAHYRSALRINPTMPYIHNNLGYALSLQGKNQEAVAHLQTALRLKPDYSIARANLEKILGAPIAAP